MANPQAENGYTAIANEILEKVYECSFTATQIKIIMVVWRYTYGFKRKEHGLSESFIAKATNISKRYISSELNKLIDNNVIRLIKESTYTQPKIISFNKHYDQWFDSGTTVQQMKDNSTVEPTQDTTVELQFNTTVEPQFHQEIKTKTKLNKDMSEVDIFFEKIWNLYRKKEGKGSVSDAQKKKLFKLGDEIVRAIERYNQKLDKEKTDIKYIKMGSSFFNSGYIDYLDAEYEQKESLKTQKEPVKIQIVEREF